MKNMVETTAGPNLVMKAIFAICAFILAVVLLPAGTAHAASYSTPSDAQASGTNGSCSWYITSASDPVNPSQLIIYPTNGTSGTLDETAPNTTRSPWGDYVSLPESLYVAEGVTTGTEARYLFSKFSNLKTADVGNLTFGDSTRHIEGMFYYCTSLQSVNTDGWDLSSITNPDAMFEGCKSLASIDMSKWDTSEVTSFSHLFAGCTSLTTVDLTPLDMGKTQTIASMFSGCKNLQSIIGLSGRDMPDLTALNTVFSGCSSLTTIDVTGLDTGNVTSFTSAFTDCSSLKSIVGLDTWDTGSGTRFYGMFDGCSSIESLDVSNFDTSNATSFEMMFADCTSLKSLDLSSFNTPNVTSFYSFLKGCENITSLDLSGFDTSKATDMVRFFYGMNRLSEVTLGTNFNFAGNGSTSGTLPTPNSNYIDGATGKWQAVGSGTVNAPAGAVYASANVPSNVAETYVPEKVKVPVLAEKDTWYAGSTAKSAIVTINIVDSYTPTGSEKESWDASAEKNGSVMAYVSADGKTLTIAGNGYGRIFTTDNASKTFYYFSEVQEIANAGLLDVSAATNVSEMFYNCDSMKSIDVSAWDVSNVTNMNEMFNGCSALENLDVSEWNTSSVTNMAGVFEACESVSELDVSKWDTSNVLTFSATFFNCPSLTSIDVSNFNTSKAKDFSSMFMNSTGLTSIDVSNFDTSNAETLSAMFDNTGITTMDISMFNTSKVTDFSRIFHNCDSLKTVVFGNINTSNVTTMSSLFDNCESLESVDLANLNTANVQDFSGMFKSCKSLEELDLSHFNTAKGTNFEKVFYLCYDLEVLNIESWNTMSATKMTDMFTSCRTLQQVTLGENFSFTGNGSASCVLPTPDAKYITGATGKWQAVGSGTVTAPKGAVYAPADVPSNVAETYVMEAPKPPVLAASNSWYTSSIDKGAFTTINIVDSYAPTGSEKESWDASSKQDGSVMAYVSADGKTLTIAGNGSGYIMANADSSFAFDSFSSATAINGTELLNTENVTRMDCMFSDCTALKSLNLDNWDVSNVYMFNIFAQDCTSLTSFGPNNLRDWDVSSAEWFSSSFMGCESLEAIDVSLWDMSSCEVLNYMFSDCKSLTTLDVSKWNLASATRAAYVFRNCTGLSTLDFTNWNTPKILDMSGLLNGCAFVTIDVSGLDMGTCEQVDWFFANCKSLASIAGINEWDVSSAKLMGDMYRNCTNLVELDLSNWKTTSMTDCTDIFSGCESLKKLDIGGFNTSGAAVSEMFNNCYRLQQVTLGVDFTFNGKNDVRSVDLPTPDPAYITGAIGKWQAVANGTVTKPAGTIYLPVDVPSNVHETYVMPITTISVDVPIKVTLAAAADGTWCTPTATANQIINHSLAPVNVVSAKAAASDGFTMLVNASVASSTADNVFGGTIAAGAGAAQDLTAIDTSADTWTMAAATDSDNSDLIGLQLTGSIGNVEGKYFTEATQLFGITYTFELAL